MTSRRATTRANRLPRGREEQTPRTRGATPRTRDRDAATAGSTRRGAIHRADGGKATPATARPRPGDRAATAAVARFRPRDRATAREKNASRRNRAKTKAARRARGRAARVRVARRRAIDPQTPVPRTPRGGGEGAIETHPKSAMAMSRTLYSRPLTVSTTHIAEGAAIFVEVCCVLRRERAVRKGATRSGETSFCPQARRVRVSQPRNGRRGGSTRGSTDRMAKEGYGLSFLEKTGLFSDRLFFLTHAARATYPGVVGANALPPGLLSASICRCIASISASSVASFALAGENDPGGTNAALDAALSFLATLALTLVPIRSRWRGERRSLRTFTGASSSSLPPPGSPVKSAVGRLGGDDDDE